MDIDFREELKGFEDDADEVNESAIRILAFVALASIGRKVVAKNYVEARDEAEILIAAIRALAKKAAQ